MAKLLKRLNPEISKYRDRRFEGSQEAFDECLRTSPTLYIGNLSFFTTEEQIWEIFSKVGDVKRIIMGLDKQKHTPCGFCFVIYYTRADADNAVKYVNGALLDERPIRVDFDWGFQEGRQYGRGRSGGQVRDEYRRDYDPGRGGYGKIVLQEMETHQGQMYSEGLADDGPPQKRVRTGDGAAEQAAEPVEGAATEEEPRGARYQRQSDDEDED